MFRQFTSYKNSSCN